MWTITCRDTVTLIPSNTYRRFVYQKWKLSIFLKSFRIISKTTRILDVPFKFTFSSQHMLWKMVSKEKLCERIYLLEALIIAHSFSSFLLKIVYNKKFCRVKILWLLTSTKKLDIYQKHENSWLQMFKITYSDSDYNNLFK